MKLYALSSCLSIMIGAMLEEAVEVAESAHTSQVINISDDENDDGIKQEIMDELIIESVPASPRPNASAAASDAVYISDGVNDQLIKQEIGDCMPIFEEMQCSVEEMIPSEDVVYISDEDSVKAIKEESIADDQGISTAKMAEQLDFEFSRKTHSQPHDFQATYDFEESLKKAKIMISSFSLNIACRKHLMTRTKRSRKQNRISAVM